MPLAIFGIDGGALDLVVNLLVLFLIVVYLALIYWTTSTPGAGSRTRLIACATAASVFPYLGTVVYTILRPPEFLEDREERELELRAAEPELRQRIEQSCPHCEYPIERNYLRCPNCERRLREPVPEVPQTTGSALGDLPLLRNRGPQAAPRARHTPRAGSSRPRPASDPPLSARASSEATAPAVAPSAPRSPKAASAAPEQFALTSPNVTR